MGVPNVRLKWSYSRSTVFIFGSINAKLIKRRDLYYGCYKTVNNRALNFCKRTTEKNRRQPDMVNL